MLWMLGLSEECLKLLEETGADIFDVGCRSGSSGADVLGGLLFFGLLVGGCLIAKGNGQL